MASLFVGLSFFVFFVLLLGSEYWFRGVNYAMVNWAAALPYCAAVCGVLWIAWVRVRWRTYRRQWCGISLFAKPLLILLFSCLVILHRGDDRQLAGVGPETLVLLLGISFSIALAIYRETSSGDWPRFALQGLFALLVVLAFSAVFHPNWSRWNQLYTYRGEHRWSGPFKNPNQFGLTMALGLVMVSAVAFLDGAKFFAGWNRSIGSSSGGPKRVRIHSWLAAGAASIFLVGLYKSYSRGAWLGGLLGLLYLAVVHYRRRVILQTGSPISAGARAAGSFQRWSAVLVIAVSVLVIGFWSFRDTDFRGIRRLYSVGNPYDSSWRNRVEAYIGALQIMADHPLWGIGWSQSDPLYSEYYMSDRLTDGLAIVLNDYFTLGMSLGLPTLSCFIAYLLTACIHCPDDKTSDDHGRLPGENAALVKTLARGEIIVLLICFWFDRGLFYWSFGILFWGLLELSSPVVLPAFGSNRIQTRAGILNGGRHSTGFALRPWLLFLAVALLFLYALVWAKVQDKFDRADFVLPLQGSGSCRGIRLSPQPPAEYPQAIYLYQTGSSLLESGQKLRLIAQSGFDTAGFEYDQDNPGVFEEQFKAICQYMQTRNGIGTNRVWVMRGAGARLGLNFAITHPELQPDMLICIDGSWTAETYEALAARKFTGPAALRSCVLLIGHTAPSDELRVRYGTLDSLLQANGACVAAGELSESGDAMESDPLISLPLAMEYAADQLPPPDYTVKLFREGVERGNADRFNAVFRRAGRNCAAVWKAVAGIDETRRREVMNQLAGASDFELTHLSQADLLQRYAFGRLWGQRAGLGLAFLVFGWLIAWGFRCQFGRIHLWFRSLKPAPGQSLRRMAWLTAIIATGTTGICLLLPQCEATGFSVWVAGLLLARSHTDDLGFLGRQETMAHKIKLETLLQHVQLADLQRHVFYKEPTTDLFQKYILSPRIDSQCANWSSRKELWDYFQPRLRNQHDPVAGAKMVLDYLQERVGIDSKYTANRDVDVIWIQGMVDEAGFERIFVAALRSIGIAARLNEFGRVEIWTGQTWVDAPAAVTLDIKPRH